MLTTLSLTTTHTKLPFDVWSFGPNVGEKALQFQSRLYPVAGGDGSSAPFEASLMQPVARRAIIGICRTCISAAAVGPHPSLRFELGDGDPGFWAHAAHLDCPDRKEKQLLTRGDSGLGWGQHRE